MLEIFFKALRYVVLRFQTLGAGGVARIGRGGGIRGWVRDNKESNRKSQGHYDE